MHNLTNNYKQKYRIATIVSWGLNILPLVIFIIIAFCNGEISSAKKISMGTMVMLAGIFVLINLLTKKSSRVIVWLLLAALTMAVEKIEALIWVELICVALDDYVVEQLKEHYGTKYKTNRDIDEREEYNSTSSSANESSESTEEQADSINS